MPKVISNTSCLIALDNIDELWILKKLYRKVIISEEVLSEFGKSIDDWVEVRSVKDKNYMQILTSLIDLGEASTIALALEVKDSLMILDDLKARKVATNLNLKFTGLLGVVLKAKQEGIISSVKEVLDKLKSARFRIAHKVEPEFCTIKQSYPDYP